MLHFFEQNNISLHLANLQILEQKKTLFHDLALYSHSLLGKILVLDDEIQHVEKWAPLYHEVLVHLPIAFLKDVRNVLILGGGSMYTALEVLKYKSVEEVIMIDHDDEVIKTVCQFYDHAEEVRCDPRFKLIIGDAFDAIRDKNNSSFDLVLNDCFDLLRLEDTKKNCFQYMNNLLNENGICADIIYRHIFEKESTLKTISLLGQMKKVFSLVVVPEYPGIMHLLTLWGKNIVLNQNLKYTLNPQQLKWIEEDSELQLLYFNPSFMHYYLYLPPYLKSIIGYNFS